MTKKLTNEYFKHAIALAETMQSDFSIALRPDNIDLTKETVADINKCHEVLYLVNYFLSSKKYKKLMYDSILIADSTLPLMTFDYSQDCLYEIFDMIKNSNDYRSYKINNILY
jgi:hypothetical protein